MDNDNSQLAELADLAVNAVDKYLAWRNLSKIRLPQLVRTLTAKGSQPEAVTLKDIDDLHNKEWDAKVEARQAIRHLAPELERLGVDSAGLLKILHFIDGGGGPDNAYPLWPDVKACLQQFAIRLRNGLVEPKKPEGDADRDQGGTGRSECKAEANTLPHNLTVSQAANVSGCNPGVISRAVDDGSLKSNGEKGRKRRIDSADLTRWQLSRAHGKETVESNEAIERKLKRARGK